MESTSELIQPQQLWQMVIAIFLWEYEYNKSSLIEMLEGCGLLDEENQEPALFLQTLTNQNPEQAIKNLTKQYSLIELSKIYNQLNSKLGDNELNPQEQKTVEQVFGAVIEMISLIDYEDDLN